jgi:hypothetical protein
LACTWRLLGAADHHCNYRARAHHLVWLEKLERCAILGIQPRWKPEEYCQAIPTTAIAAISKELSVEFLSGNPVPGLTSTIGFAGSNASPHIPRVLEGASAGRACGDYNVLPTDLVVHPSERSDRRGQTRASIDLRAKMRDARPSRRISIAFCAGSHAPTR